MSDRRTFLLDESRLPKAWYNINADMPVPPQPVLHPETLQPVTPDFLSVLFPMEIIKQEVSAERWIEIPEPVREIYRLWRPTPMYRALRLEKMLGHAGAHLLQVRRREPGRVAQAEHRRPAGVLQQAGRREGDDHRDGRRPVGDGAGDGVQFLRARPRSLHGEGLVPPEAVPPGDHGELRREGVREPEHADDVRADRSWPRPGFATARSASRSRKRWRRRPRRAATKSTGSDRCSGTCSCTRR